MLIDEKIQCNKLYYEFEESRFLSRQFTTNLQNVHRFIEQLVSE